MPDMRTGGSVKCKEGHIAQAVYGRFGDSLNSIGYYCSSCKNIYMKKEDKVYITERRKVL